MSSNRFAKGKLYRFLDYVLRLVLLNFLMIIPSFSFLIIYSLFSKDTTSIWFYLTLIPLVIYLFPSIVATTDVIRQYEDDQTNTIFKDFFKSLKKHYIKAFIIGIIVIVFVFLLSNSLTYFINNHSRDYVHIIGLFVTISFILIAIFLLAHLPLVMVYFSDLSIFEYFKLALIMSFKDFGTTFIMTLIIVIVLVVSLLYYFVMFIAGISIMIYFIVKLTFKQYIKIYRKVEKND